MSELPVALEGASPLDRSPRSGANRGGASRTKTGRGSLTGGRGRDAEVVEAAIQVFATLGYSAATVADVAEALGMGKPTLYHYIKSKDDLLARIFEGSHAETKRLIDSVSESSGSAVEKLREFFYRYSLWALENSSRAGIYAREWRYLTGDLRQVVVRRRAYYDSFVRDLVDKAKEQGDVRPTTSTLEAAFFVMSAITALPDWYQPKGREAPAVVAARYADFALAVLTSDVSPGESS